MADALRCVFSGRFKIWQKLTALVPVLLLLVAAPGQELLRCSMDGLLRTSCCCPAAKETKDDGVTAVLKTQGCCDRAVVVGDHPPAESTSRTIHDTLDWVSFEVLASPLAFVLDDRGRDRLVRHSNGPPPNGPSVLLLKSAFLI